MKMNKCIRCNSEIPEDEEYTKVEGGVVCRYCNSWLNNNNKCFQVEMAGMFNELEKTIKTFIIQERKKK